MYRNSLFGILFLLPIGILFAQVPQSFNYQAIVRSGGELVTNEIIDITVQLIQSGEVVYIEEHDNLNTGNLGRINFQIGDGNNPSTNFSQINWGLGNVAVQLSINGESLEVVPLSSVPYANYSSESTTDNDWFSSGDSLVYTLDKNVGIGLENPQYPLHVAGDRIKLDGLNDADLELNITSTDTNNPEIRFSVAGEQKGMLRLQHTSGRMILQESLSADNTTTISMINGSVGINTLSPASADQLTVRGVMRITGIDAHQKLRMYSSSSTLDNRITSYDENSDLMWSIVMGDRSDGDDFYIDRPGNGVRDFYIDNNARTHVRTLEIHGGSDINEDFNSSTELSPGDVVVIDARNEGELCHTSTEYDRKVAGVISGANGVNPGLSLSQEDVLEGEYPLAMLGRVYVKVTGSVSVGDMLTTSSKPGFAMTVIDYERSRGAVIGKAMSSNKGEEGMVLVLIQPQWLDFDH